VKFDKLKKYFIELARYQKVSFAISRLAIHAHLYMVVLLKRF